VDCARYSDWMIHCWLPHASSRGSLALVGYFHQIVSVASGLRGATTGGRGELE
jgi:hypothetical protein